MYVSSKKVASFDELYGKYARDVFQFVLYLSGDKARAEDITSEVFLRVWTSDAEIRAVTVKAYLFTIARNLYLEQWRRERRNTELPEHISTSGTQFNDAANREHLARVTEAMQELPELERAAVLLRAEEELSYAIIGQLLDIPEATARMKVYRARVRLVEILGRKK